MAISARETRLRQQLQRDLGDRPQRPFGAGEEPAQVVAGDVLHRAAAGADRRPVRQHDLEREDVVAGDAVLQAARAPGVLRDVPADRALLETRRIGRVEEPALLDLGLQPRVDHAGLDDRDAVDLVDLEDPVHPRDAEDDAARQRDGAAGEPAPHRARRDRDAARGRDAVDGTHLGGRRGQHDERRDALVERPVEAVRDQVLGLGEDPARDRGAQLVD
jgi:hypothetical protein